jgi:ribosomal protein S18 acetylase RimI-like enzyme
MTLEKFTLRHYLPEDYPALADVANAVHIRLGDERRVTAEEIATYLDTPEFNPATDSFIIEKDGRIAGFCDAEFSAETGRCWVDGMVHPDDWGQGIGAELIRLTEARCLDWAQSAVAPDHSISIQRYTVETNTRARRLFEAQGYEHIRTFYRMRCDLDQPIEAPPLPNGLVLRPFDLERDAQAVYEAQMDSFADHWGFERDSYEMWTQEVLKHPTNDGGALWQVAYDGDEIAGVCLNWRDDGDDKMGFIARLGVRRAWRRQGLGEALLLNSFARFQDAGFTRAGLMVDSDSPTNAVALYERVGMHVQRRTLVYRKMLREAAEAAG